MKNFIKQMARALYQILVVGIVCLPYRLACLIYVLFTMLMVPGTPGLTMKSYISDVLSQFAIAYKIRANWVKNGDKFNSDF